MEISTLVRANYLIREQLDAVEGSISDDVKRLKEQLKKIELMTLDLLNKSGSNSISTDYGTAFKKEKDTFKIEDREAFFNWVAENNMWHMLPTSINNTDARDYMEKNGGALPPGIGYSAFIVAQFRKPKAKVK